MAGRGTPGPPHAAYPDAPALDASLGRSSVEPDHVRRSAVAIVPTRLPERWVDAAIVVQPRDVAQDGNRARGIRVHLGRGTAVDRAVPRRRRRGRVLAGHAPAFASRSSHFYPADPAGFAGVRNKSDWQYETIAFHVRVPAAGACAAGTLPVYRMYNNGQTGAPNHRFTTSLAVYQDFTTQQGWSGEGVRFCAPE